MIARFKAWARSLRQKIALAASEALISEADDLDELIRVELERSSQAADDLASVGMVPVTPEFVELAQAIEDRISTIADEAFGPFPVQHPDDDLSEIEHGITALRIECAAAVVEASDLDGRLRRVVEELGRMLVLFDTGTYTAHMCDVNTIRTARKVYQAELDILMEATCTATH